MRLFLAFEVPEAEKTMLENQLQGIRIALPEARWIPRQSWHVSVKFLGEVPEVRLNEVLRLAGESASQSAAFSARLFGAGAFPSARRARVVWAGVQEDPPGSAARLAGEVEAKFGAAGFRREGRDFKPHLTVSRLRAPRLVAEALTGLSQLEGGWFRLEELVLFHSHLSPKGASYEKIAALPLS